ncbi:MAG: glycosyltransferase family 4 protein [Acidimicrobiales bacterium]
MKEPARGLPGDGHRPRLAFVLEQSLGHAVHGLSIEAALHGRADIAARVMRVEAPPAALWRRLPLVGNWSFQASWAARSALRGALAPVPVDALFIHTQVASLLSVAAMRRVPTVVSMDATPRNFDTLGAGYGHRLQGRVAEHLKREVNRRALAAARAIVTWSQWAADSVVDDYRIPGSRVHVVRPGVDLRRFRPGPAVGPGDRVRIVFVGGNFERKGGHDLLQAVRRFGDSVELDIVTLSRLPSLPSTPRVRVHRVGHGSDDLLALYRQADIFALPSRGECYGLVFAEAMASGLPIVACGVGAVPELVVDGHNGILVPPGDIPRLAGALSALVESPGLRASMGQHGLLMARRDHDAERNCGRIFDLMLDLASLGQELVAR